MRGGEGRGGQGRSGGEWGGGREGAQGRRGSVRGQAAREPKQFFELPRAFSLCL